MQIYLAPLQGLTDSIFRESFSQHIGQFDKTFSPFIRVQHGEFYRPNQCKDILPAQNTFQKPVPQFLGNDIDSFRRFESFCLENDYNEVNINMGCPYPMVTSKKMGAGLLNHPQQISKLLNDIFASTQLKVSVKCRVGMESSDGFGELVSVFNDFPLEELIIHPRIGKQQYKGMSDKEIFAQYFPMIKHSVCYNGDILTIEDVQNLEKEFPALNKIMIGRGILENPFLLHEIRNEELSATEKMSKLRDFHIALIELSKLKYSGDLHFLKHVEELWEYHSKGFEDGHKMFKQIKKCKSVAKYEEIILSILR